MVVALPFSSAEASTEKRVVDLPKLVVVGFPQAPRDASVQESLEYLGEQNPQAHTAAVIDFRLVPPEAQPGSSVDAGVSRHWALCLR